MQTVINYAKGDLLERVSQNGLQELMKDHTEAGSEIWLLVTYKGPEAN